jgi:glycosyltransferase involved in cell wall biosynthesis
MKLLIVTQKLDENDPVLGFFVRWVAEFAKHFDTIHVIAFYAGKHSLPENVTVHSLGKERGAGKLARSLRYLSLVISLRREYGDVFAHMSPEYVISAGPLWKLLGKRIALWYNHASDNWRLSLAASLADVVFHTSPYAAPARFENAKRMPAGIDTALFKPQPVEKNPHRAYFQGRVAPAKRVHVMCEAILALWKKGVSVTLGIVGPEDAEYARSLKEKYKSLTAEGAISFLGPQPPSATPALYSSARVSINLTDAGNYDKTVLESAACGTPVIVGSKAFADIIPERFIVPSEDPVALAKAIEAMLALSEGDYAALAKDLRDAVVSRHDISMLGRRVSEAFADLYA